MGCRGQCVSLAGRPAVRVFGCRAPGLARVGRNNTYSTGAWWLGLEGGPLQVRDPSARDFLRLARLMCPGAARPPQYTYTLLQCATETLAANAGQPYASRWGRGVLNDPSATGGSHPSTGHPLCEHAGQALCASCGSRQLAHSGYEERGGLEAEGCLRPPAPAFRAAPPLNRIHTRNRSPEHSRRGGRHTCPKRGGARLAGGCSLRAQPPPHRACMNISTVCTRTHARDALRRTAYACVR